MFEQGGKTRAEYDEELLKRRPQDLTARYGRGFSKSNHFLMRSFYLGWQIFQTPSGIFEARAEPADSAGSKGPSVVEINQGRTDILGLAPAFPLPWSYYVGARCRGEAGRPAVIPGRCRTLRARQKPSDENSRQRISAARCRPRYGPLVRFDTVTPLSSLEFTVARRSSPKLSAGKPPPPFDTIKPFSEHNQA
jgi:hypothetical protein